MLTASIDALIKIWSMEGELVAKLNVNHPLPLLWNLSTVNFEDKSARVLVAVRVLDAVLVRH